MTSRARRLLGKIEDGLRHKHLFGITIRTWWTFVLACAVTTVGAWVAIDHTNASQDQQQAAYRRDQDRRQAVFRQQLEAKFEQALRISSAQANYSINKSVCGWRKVFGPLVKDTRVPARRREQIRVFLENQVTVPPDFKCSTLPPKPPKPPQ